MRKILLIIYVISISGLYAQVAINDDGTNPDASAMLEVKSTDKGFLMPRMNYNTMTGIQNPAEGLLVYVQDKDAFYYFDGIEWILASADNLGNHKATENLQMQGHWITNDGDDEGIFVTDQGKVGINTTTPTAMLHLKGDDPDIDLDINSSSSALKAEVRFKEDGDKKAKMYYQKNTGDFIFEHLSKRGAIKFSIDFVPAMVIYTNRKVEIQKRFRINPTSQPTDAEDGDIYFDSNSKKLRCYSNGSWHDLW